MYKVTKFFTDLQDNSHPYNIGDVFPREGKDVSKKRINELASSENRQGVPLIEKVEEELEEIEETEEVEDTKPEKTSETDQGKRGRKRNR